MLIRIFLYSSLISLIISYLTSNFLFINCYYLFAIIAIHTIYPFVSIADKRNSKRTLNSFFPNSSLIFVYSLRSSKHLAYAASHSGTVLIPAAQPLPMSDRGNSNMCRVRAWVDGRLMINRRYPPAGGHGWTGG